jgi:hypothetical protein
MPLRLRLIPSRLSLRAFSGALAVAGATAWAASAQAAPTVAELQERLTAHLEFGEFERAMQIAGEAGSAEDKSQLLGLIADAQMKNGDFGSALGSIRSMPDYMERRIARSRHAEASAAAGGIQADFTQLIDLIMSETNGMWEEVDGSGGTISEFLQGIRVEPTGVMTKVSATEQTGRLKELGVQVREAMLNQDIAQPADMRVISLARLEEAVSRSISRGQPVPVSARLMGGLTQITHVFVYPEEHDVVLAGPAEGWKYNASGVAVGITSGKPVLQLDDFVTVLRAFEATDQKYFSVSINPRPEGLKRLREYVQRTSSRPLTSDAAVRTWVNELQQQVGRQDFVYTGIAPDTRVARIIAEADYRMKLAGIGKYDFSGGTRVPSIFQLMSVEEQKSSKLDALRWWLTMKYDAVLHTADRNGYEFVGSSVLCQSENQFLNDQGQQVQTGQSEGANRAFAEAFTSKYDELAKTDLVFADLKNVFDLALVAAILHNEGAAERAGWNYGTFSQEGAYLPAVYTAPTEVDSVVNHRTFRGRDIVVQVAGGVRVDLASVLDNREITKEGVRLDSTARKAHERSPELPARRWWWDAR